MSEFRRGGFSSEFNTYSTWINNPPGKLFDTAADGSWLDNGDYDRAYRGFPSFKQVNVNFGGGIFAAPSWKASLGFGIGRLATAGLGLWLLGRFKGKQQAAQPQANLGLNAYLTYFNNLKSRFWPIGIGGTTGGTGGAGGAGGTQTVIHKCDCKCCNGTEKPEEGEDSGKKPGTNPTNPVGDGGDNGDKVYDAVATNKKYSPVNIQGTVKNVGDLNDAGYPATFEIHDSTKTGDTDHPNIYKYEYVKEENGKPIYKCVSAQVFVEKGKDKSKVKGDQVSYSVGSGITKDKGITGKLDNMAAVDPTGTLIHYNELSEYSEGKVEQITINFEE